MSLIHLSNALLSFVLFHVFALAFWLLSSKSNLVSQKVALTHLWNMTWQGRTRQTPRSSRQQVLRFRHHLCRYIAAFCCFSHLTKEGKHYQRFGTLACKRSAPLSFRCFMILLNSLSCLASPYSVQATVASSEMHAECTKQLLPPAAHQAKIE